LILLIIFFTLVACSVSQRVNTDSTRQFEQDLILNSVIKDVNFTFVRPYLRCNILTVHDLTDDDINFILNNAKALVTLENMNQIGQSVNWNIEISRFEIIINTDKDKEHKYYSKYFKSYDTTDKSPENIEAYQIWYKE